MKQSKHGISECDAMSDMLIVFFFGFVMGGGLLAVVLKSIFEQDRKDKNDEI